MIDLGGQQRDSAMHIHICILPQTPFLSRLPHNIEQSSLGSILVLIPSDLGPTMAQMKRLLEPGSHRLSPLRETLPSPMWPVLSIPAQRQHWAVSHESVLLWAGHASSLGGFMKSRWGAGSGWLETRGTGEVLGWGAHVWGYFLLVSPSLSCPT